MMEDAKILAAAKILCRHDKGKDSMDWCPLSTGTDPGDAGGDRWRPLATTAAAGDRWPAMWPAMACHGLPTEAGDSLLSHAIAESSQATVASQLARSAMSGVKASN